VVRYARHPLDIDEVRKHIEHGKLPTKLAMTWDDRVSFVLTEGLQIKNITLLDAVMDGNSKDDSGFDTDVAIATGELSRLIPDLIEALGGEGRTRLGDLPASLRTRLLRKLCAASTARTAPARTAKLLAMVRTRSMPRPLNWCARTGSQHLLCAAQAVDWLQPRRLAGAHGTRDWCRAWMAAASARF
jgi:hypothetical protein